MQAHLSPLARWGLALAATATMAVSYVDRQALAVLAPTITKALHFSDAAYGWLAAAFSIAYLLCAPVAGRFIDAVGARRGLVASVLVWSLVAAAHALVPGFATLFTLRILLGAAEAPSFPAAAQTVSRVLPLADRGLGFGILFTGSSLGAMVAPLLVTWLEARWGWRLAMVGTAVVGLTWLPLWLAVTASPGARRALSGAGAGAELATVPAGNAAAPPPVIDALGLALHPAVVRAVLLVLCSAPIGTFVINWGAKILVQVHQMTQKQVGGYLWLPPVALDLGAVGFGALATLRERMVGAGADAPHRLLLAGAALLTCCVAALPFATTPWGTTAVLALGLGGTGGLYALASADMLRRVPPGAVATAGGLTAAAQSLAYVIVNPVIGRVVDRVHSYDRIAIALALTVIPGAIVWIAWDPRPSPGAAR